MGVKIGAALGAHVTMITTTPSKGEDARELGADDVIISTDPKQMEEAGTRFDFITTLIVLIGYAIPGFVLGVALLVIFGGQLQWFPLRGLTSPNWDELSWPARIVDSKPLTDVPPPLAPVCSERPTS